MRETEFNFVFDDFHCIFLKRHITLYKFLFFLKKSNPGDVLTERRILQRNVENVVMDTRICKVCEIEKPLSSFSKRRANKTDKRFYHRHQCNTCMSRQNKARPKGRETVRRIAKSCQQKYRQRVPEMKLQLFKDIGQTQCKHCRISNPIVLCFHHRDKKEKSFGIAWAFTHSYAYETILREAKKCDILCANCHLILHATEETHVSLQTQSHRDEACQPFP